MRLPLHHCRRFVLFGFALWSINVGVSYSDDTRATSVNISASNLTNDEANISRSNTEQKQPRLDITSDQNAIFFDRGTVDLNESALQENNISRWKHAASSNLLSHPEFDGSSESVSEVKSEHKRDSEPVVVVARQMVSSPLESPQGAASINESEVVDVLAADEEVTGEHLMDVLVATADDGEAGVLSRQFGELSEPGSGGDIPPFNEWALKKAEETAKLSLSGVPPVSVGGAVPGVSRQVRHRQKNHASLDCSAKVLASNAESNGAHHVLSVGRDEYMLNPCHARVFIVVELCEPVQISRIEMSNDELYSSSVRQFSVSVSDGYPTRDWRIVGTFIAAEKRGLQVFNITSNVTSKFLRLDVLNHYNGTYYYCTLSTLRVYGANEYEVIDHQDAIDNTGSRSGDYNQFEHSIDTYDSKRKTPNLIDRAIEAVSTMVDSARQAIATGTISGWHVVSDSCLCLDLRWFPGNITVQARDRLSCLWQQVERLGHLHQLSIRLVQCGFCADLSSSSNASLACRWIQVVWSSVDIQLLCTLLHMDRRLLSEDKSHFPNTSCIHGLNGNVSSNKKYLNSNAEHLEVRWNDDLPTEDNLVPPTYPANGSDVSSIIGTSGIDESLENANSNASLSPNSTRTRMVSSLDNSSVASPPLYNASSAYQNESVPERDTKEFEMTDEEVRTGQPLLQESAFVRLGNRIRVLERNMSLSSQYLDELSRRYRRQVEDMQKTFNRTIAALELTAREAEQRDQLQQEMIRSLHIQLMDLSDVVRQLVAERDQTTWMMLQRHAALIVVEVCVLCVACALCARHLTQCCRDRRNSRLTATAYAKPRGTAQHAPGRIVHRSISGHNRTASDETVFLPGKNRSVCDTEERQHSCAGVLFAGNSEFPNSHKDQYSTGLKKDCCISFSGVKSDGLSTHFSNIGSMNGHSSVAVRVRKTKNREHVFPQKRQFH